LSVSVSNFHFRFSARSAEGEVCFGGHPRPVPIHGRIIVISLRKCNALPGPRRGKRGRAFILRGSIAEDGRDAVAATALARGRK
jgi:hypothetical protein